MVVRVVAGRWLAVLGLCLVSVEHISCELGLRLRNQEYYHNDVIDMNIVGEGDNALLCTTDLPGCCRTVNLRIGEWLYPNGSMVPPGNSGRAVYRNRGEGYIRLNKRVNGFAEGEFCCQLQDHTQVQQTICTYLYSRDSPPLLLANPEDQLDVIPGDNVMFSVSVLGIGLAYRWQLINGTLLPEHDQRYDGINSPTLTIRVVSGLDIGMYHCIISNAAGSVASLGARLTVAGPQIILNPVSALSVDPGSDVSFRVEATGASLYDWARSGHFFRMDTTRLRGVRAPMLTIIGVTAEDEGDYTCFASNGQVTIQSNVAHLSLLDAPIILQQPLDVLSAIPGNSVSFYVLVSGLRVTYLWLKSGAGSLPNTTKFEGRNSSTLTIHDIVSSDVGSYHCLITNAAGSIISSNATLELGQLGPVEDLHVVPVSTSAVISWAPPALLAGFTVLSYELQYHPPAYPILPLGVNTTANVTSHQIVGLIPGATYRLEVRVYTIKGPGEWGRTEFTVDRSIPPVENVRVSSAANRAVVVVTWTPLVLPGWSPSYYLIYCDNSSISANSIKSVIGNTSSADIDIHEVPVDGMDINFQVSALFTLDLEGVSPFEGTKSNAVSIQLTPESALFQLHLGPVDYCVTWNDERAETIETTIHETLSSVNCMHNTILRKGAFSCRNHANTVTYRSTIVGVAAAADLNCIQMWVDSGPIMKLDWYYVNVYTNCPIRVASLTEPECDKPASVPTPSLLMPFNNATSTCVNRCFSHINTNSTCDVNELV